MTAPTTRRAGIQFYQGDKAPEVRDTGFLAELRMSEQTAAAYARRRQAGADDGSSLKALVAQSEDDGGFHLIHVWFKPNFPLPSHSHSSDCLYYVISGTAIMGKRTLRAGDSFFVSADVSYQYAAGPEGVEVLEIRHGAASVRTDFAEEPLSRWDKNIAVVEQQSATWRAMTTAPTFSQPNRKTD